MLAYSVADTEKAWYKAVIDVELKSYIQNRTQSGFPITLNDKVYENITYIVYRDHLNKQNARLNFNVEPMDPDESKMRIRYSIERYCKFFEKL